MITKIINFSVDKYCNYIVSVISKLGNSIIISIDQDTNFEKYSIQNTKIHRFHYFNGNTNIITFNCQSIFYFKIKLKKKDIKINQLYIAEHLRNGFSKQLKMSTPLVEYNNNYLPAIYYGIWSENDLIALQNNKSLKIIIWSGGDINSDNYREDYIRENVEKNISEIKKITKVIHISKSSFIDKSLDEFDIPYIKIPYIAIDFNLYKPTIKGNNIYIYTAPGSEKYYGEELYDQVINKYKHINFIFACCEQSYNFIKSSQDEVDNEFKYESKYDIRYYNKNVLLNKIYPKCFLGLRLTIHDGIANTVQELGLLGIKSIHNGNGPSCLKYESFDDICAHIDNEINYIGTCDEKLASEVKKYLTLDSNFYNTSFYKNNY